ncbi:MAG: sugar phosphate isomerase/epimerase family protein [Anaerolineae bacterium]
MKPCLFSVSYAGLWGQHRLDLPQFLHKAAELGYPAVELMAKRPHLSPLDWDDTALRSLRQLADDLGLEITTLAAYNDFTARGAGEVPLLEMQLQYIRAVAQMAHVLRAGLVRVFTGYTTDENAYQADWQHCLEAVRTCASYAADEGVLLGVQNHHDTAVSCEAYLEFLDEVDHPNCRAMFDPWAPALQHADLFTWARKLAPRMAQTTLADYVKLPRYTYLPGLVNYRPLEEMVRAVPLGAGFLDLPAFFNGLQEGGFDGYVAYEICSPLRGGGTEANLDNSARASLAYIRSLS